MGTESICSGGAVCTVYRRAQCGPVLYWCTGAESGAKTAERIAALAGGVPYTLAALHVQDWNSSYSPWAAPAVFGQAAFSGGADVTMDWLVRECMPFAEAGRTGCRRMIGGYSLAGLFSLYAWYETGLFDGAASCSGSLWYPGWRDYAREKRAQRPSLVYLSLGDKEERTRHAAMAAVGERTRWQHEQLLADPMIASAALEWHPGGHFHETEQRTAKGFAWLLEHEQGKEENA